MGVSCRDVSLQELAPENRRTLTKQPCASCPIFNAAISAVEMTKADLGVCVPSLLLCVSALPPSTRDVLLQTLCPIPLRCLWPNPTCKQLQ